MKKMIFIGGDMRYVHAASFLRGKYDCALYGFDNASDIYGMHPFDGSSGYDIAVLPVMTHGEIISFPLGNSPDLGAGMLSDVVARGGVVFAGKCPQQLQQICDENGFALYDYLEREEFSVMNAVLTAEGAVSIAIKETDAALHGADVLILGFGRIGKVTARYFAALGAHVTCAARKHSDIAWISACGYTPISFGDSSEFEDALSKADIILNTAPAKLITGSRTDKIRKHALLIELASESCTEEDAREKFRIIKAGGLPGRYSPVTAGKIIADTIENILTERSMKNGGA